MRRLAALLVVAIALMACGGDDDQSVEAGSETTTTSTTPEPGSTTTTPEETTVSPDTGDIALTIEVVSEGAPLRDATLVCGSAGVEGTGYLADPAAARAACDLLTADPNVVTRLVQGRDPGRMCTQQYGGPEVARVTGTIDGRRVDVEIDRTDGCGIAEWSALTALLGSPAT
jgi:hypothetical protein